MWQLITSSCLNTGQSLCAFGEDASGYATLTRASVMINLMPNTRLSQLWKK